METALLVLSLIFMTLGLTHSFISGSQASSNNYNANDELATSINSLKVATLNCWGLLWSKDRSKRIPIIASALAYYSPDLIALQEVFVESDWKLLTSQLTSLYKYHVYYPAGVVGSGLGILSKWPIEQASFKKYSINGSPAWFYHGDWYAGKGLAYAQIRAGGQTINLFNTHIHAEYNKSARSYELHQLSQLVELRQAIEKYATESDLTLAVGDWNCFEESLPFVAAIKDGIMSDRKVQLTDAWLEARQGDKSKATFNNPASEYHNSKMPEQRIDYITYNGPTWTCTDAKIVTKHSGVTLSDHSLLLATFHHKSLENELDFEEARHSYTFDKHQDRLEHQKQSIDELINRDLVSINKNRFRFRLIGILSACFSLFCFVFGLVRSRQTQWHRVNIESDNENSSRAIGKWHGFLTSLLFIASLLFVLPTMLGLLMSDLWAKEELNSMRMFSITWITWYNAFK